MANDLNQCNFIGRLGADPDVRYAGNGDAIVNFRIAVGWKTKDKEGAEWVPVVAFGKLGEICAQYLKKGSQVFVSGRFKTDEYEKNGERRYSTKVVADRMQMLGGAGGDAGQGRQPSAPAQRPQPSSRGGGASGFDDMDDDIPFASCAIEHDVIWKKLTKEVTK